MTNWSPFPFLSLSLISFWVSFLNNQLFPLFSSPYVYLPESSIFFITGFRSLFWAFMLYPILDSFFFSFLFF